MTGARQSLGSRVQHLIFAPHSRTSYLDALFEDAGTYLLQTNNSFLAANRQGGLPRPHSRPIYSTRGSREGYNARFVPHFGSSDHMCFVDGAIGVPAVALINWDDDFIHSSDDDLDKIDQTQLQRNDFLIGSLAYFLAFRAEAKDVPLLVAETFSQGQRRLANDLTVAMRVLKNSTPDGRDSAWKSANILIEQGVQREVRALNSIRVFAGPDQTASEMIDQILARAREKQMELMADLSAFALQVHGWSPPSIQLTSEEAEADKKIPVNVAPLKDYFEARRGIHEPSPLHGLMRTEVFNFVDGERSYYDIYKAVAAEAMDAGSWYYGTVNLHDVTALLDAGVQAKALTLK